jgi:hypothetical protein
MAGTHSMALRRKATDDAPPYDPQIWENDCFYLSRLMKEAKLHSVDTARLSSRTIDPFAANRADRGPRNASNTGSIHVLPAEPNWFKRQWLWVRNKVLGDGKLANGILSPVSSAAVTAGGGPQPRAPLPDLTNKTEAEYTPTMIQGYCRGGGTCTSFVVTKRSTPYIPGDNSMLFSDP